MNSIKVCMDYKSYYSKPTDEEVPRISKRIAEQTKQLNSENIRSFAGDIGLDGRTFCPATFNGGERRKDNFEQMQLFGLDFDNDKPESKISFKDVKDRADRNNLPILFAYETFTSKRRDRFRVVFLNDAPITSVRDAEVIQNALVTMFPECDKGSRDITRMYYGSRKDELLFFDKSVPKINAVSTVTGMTSYLEERYGKTNYRRKVDEFISANGLAANSKGMPDISIAFESPPSGNDAEVIGAPPNDKISPISTIYSNISTIEGFGEKLSRQYYQIRYDNGTKVSATERMAPNHAILRSKDLPQLRSVCQLLREFESGDHRLRHHELFGLATNLTNVETGNGLFLDTFERNAYADGRVGKVGYWRHQLKNYINGYKPQSCGSFCPYHGTCHHGANLLSTAKLKYHQMERISGYDEHLVCLDEAEKDFKKRFMEAMNDPRKMWFILKSQTAIGKTQTYLELILDTSLRVLIAVPTNKLKHEVRKRAKKLGIDIIESPSLRDIKDEIPNDIWNNIEYLYASGKSVIPYLKKVIKEDDPECSALFKKYLRELDEFKQYGGHAITTHKRFLTMDVSKYDLVVIDEDILIGSIIQNKEDISVSMLKKLRKETAPGSAVRKKVCVALKYIRWDDKPSDFFELSAIEQDAEDDGIAMGVDIPSFCSATHFLYRKASDKENNINEDCITFIKPVEFKPETKYIMVSATVDETVSEYYFGTENVVFTECKKARLKGVIYQDHSRSMSRVDIRKNQGIIEKIKKWSGFIHTISFKEFMKHYTGDLQFGNCAGCDTMKGEDIDIIGTPHVPEWIYKLFAYTIGCEFDTEAGISPNLIVEHNGWRFRFTTYKDEVLLAIQFYIIESQLEQAVGRARLLRCKCTVNLFSNFPISQAIMKEFDYDNHAGADGTVKAER